MISFVTCSIDPAQRERLRQNLAETVGVEHELIAHDNREVGWGLARAYNHGAAQARFPLLCFLHEDVLFRTGDFGQELLRFYAATPGAGLVGFAGCQVKSRVRSGWGNLARYNRMHMLQHGRSARISFKRDNPEGATYSRVVVLDGLAFFAPRAVWEAHRFDEQAFPGFHCYDLDFSTQVARHHANYVCHAVLAEHLSPGSFNRAWYAATDAYHRKWAELLPLACVELDAGQRQAIEGYSAYRFYRDLVDDRQASPELLDSARRDYLRHRTPLRALKLGWRGLRRRLRGGTGSPR